MIQEISYFVARYKNSSLCEVRFKMMLLLFGNN